MTLLFAQTAAFDYVYFDDAKYVLENPAVRAGLTLDGTPTRFPLEHLGSGPALGGPLHAVSAARGSPPHRG